MIIKKNNLVYQILKQGFEFLYIYKNLKYIYLDNKRKYVFYFNNIIIEKIFLKIFIKIKKYIMIRKRDIVMIFYIVYFSNF